MKKYAAATRQAVIFATHDSTIGFSFGDILDELNLDLLIVGTSDDARRMALEIQTAAVVLDALQMRESGFLTCAKIVVSLPETRVILYGPESEDLEQFALFAGASGYLTPKSVSADFRRTLGNH